MADKKISELDSVLLINDDAVFPMSQDNAGEPTTFKVGITQLGTEIAEDMTFSNLQTTSKKLVGAINELLSLGSPIIIGTTAPTSSQGANGNLYIQYTAGTGGADDEVDGIFVKINGAWCEIQTGGGGAGGHTIVDNAGTDLAQRTNLQFLGAYSEDNSTDDTTEVNVVRSMTKAEFNQLSAAEKVGFINITDEEGQITADNLPISSSDPTNTKDYIDTGLSGKQGKINNSYLIDGLSTPSGITRQNGGYTQIGNLVIVNVRLNCTNSVATETDILLGLPAPVGSANIVSVTLNKDTYAVLTTSGNIRIVGNTLTSGIVLASACYLTATT